MGFPEELKAKRQWVCWRLTPDKDGNDRKVPFNPVTGKAAASNKPETWTDYATAVDALDRYGYTGIGFMFLKDDNIVGVDIDHCYNKGTKKFNETASAILKKQPTYAEFSPSGEGVHLWFKGRKPDGSSKNSSTGVEMYDSVRYFTVTENMVPDSINTLSDGNDTLKWIHETYIVTKKSSKKKQRKKMNSLALSDDEILDKAKSSADGDTFTALWEGKWSEEYQSQSEADLSLCNKLAFWSGKNKEQMDRLFRLSALFREKWDVKHHADGKTYGEETLDKAIEHTDSVYSPDNENPIFVYEGRYYRSRGDNMYPITNFVFVPVEMITSEDETQLAADLVTIRGETYRVTFMTTDFANQQKFKNLLNRNTIALSYFGSDGDLELLKSYISELDWVHKTGVKAAGIYEHAGRNVYVSTVGSIEVGGTAVDDIVQLEKYQSIQSDILSCDLITKEEMQNLGKLLISYNEPAKTISILAWASACFVKSHLHKEGIKFPHLFLIGEAGSGKSTTLEYVLLPIFSTNRVTAASQVTQFTLMKESASSNMVPLPLDEFKPSKMDKIRCNTLYNHFRDSYDCHNGQRGRADQSMISYSLVAPLIVAGEESADEAAIRERTIELLFSKKDIKMPEQRTAFNRLHSCEKELGDFGRSLLNTALKVTPDTCSSWYKESIDIFSKELPSRVTSNLACCYVGLKLIETMLKSFGLTWAEVFPYSMDICVKHIEYGAMEYLLDGCIHNKSIIEQAFEVMSRMGLDPKVDYTFSNDGDVLYIRLAHIYDRFTKYKKDYAIFGETLTYAQFKKQLQHSDLFIDSNVQKKFGTDNCKCWVINYKELKERCEVSGFNLTEIQPL